jgi:hypothetical protein
MVIYPLKDIIQIPFQMDLKKILWRWNFKAKSIIINGKEDGIWETYFPKWTKLNKTNFKME